MIDLIGGWTFVAILSAIVTYPLGWGVVALFNLWVKHVTRGDIMLLKTNYTQLGNTEEDRKEAEKYIGRRVYYGDSSQSECTSILESVHKTALREPYKVLARPHRYENVWVPNGAMTEFLDRNYFYLLATGILTVLTTLVGLVYMIKNGTGPRGYLLDFYYPVTYSIGEFISPVLVFGLLLWGITKAARSSWDFKRRVDEAISEKED